VKEARQMGLTYRFAGAAGMSQPVFIRRATAQAAQGVLSSTDFVESNPDPKVQDFVKRYREAYGTEPDVHAAAYYDAAVLAAKSIASAGTPEVSRVRGAAGNLRYPGILANYRCSAKGDCNQQLNIAEIDVGVPVLKYTMKF
jgi:branched-chain amino acid transport system substrate-binding protein